MNFGNEMNAKLVFAPIARHAAGVLRITLNVSRMAITTRRCLNSRRRFFTTLPRCGRFFLSISAISFHFIPVTIANPQASIRISSCWNERARRGGLLMPSRPWSRRRRVFMRKWILRKRSSFPRSFGPLRAVVKMRACIIRRWLCFIAGLKGPGDPEAAVVGERSRSKAPGSAPVSGAGFGVSPKRTFICAMGMAWSRFKKSAKAGTPSPAPETDALPRVLRPRV